MDNPMRAEGVFIDFDGVISRNAVERIISFVHGYMNLHTPIELEYLKSYIKAISCFPVAASAQLLFSAFGIEKHTNDFFRAFKEFDNQHDASQIDEDSKTFLKYCQKSGIQYKILSLASPHKLKAANIAASHIYPLNDRSKADPKTFLEIEQEMGINLNEWAYIEDNPLALQAAKLSGLNTIMMLNNIYTEADYSIFKDYIDFKVDSFDPIVQLGIF